MASSCVPVPTLTGTQVSTSQSFVTTSTPSISTAPGSVSTAVLSTCVGVQSSSCQPTVITSFVTVPGSTATVNVPATLTVDFPVTVLTTFFGSSCSSISIPPSDSSTSPIPTSTPTPSFSLPSLTSTPDTSTTPILLPSFTSSSTLPTTTLPGQSTGGSSENRIAVGPVVGGVLGGIAALLLLGLLTLRLVKKQSKFDDFFHSDDDHRHSTHPSDPLIEKPPYHYGLVGQNNFVLEPLHPPPAVQTAYGNIGSVGQAQGLSQAITSSQTVVGEVGGLGQVSSQASSPAAGGQFLSSQANGQASVQASPPGLGTQAGGRLGQRGTGAHDTIGNLPSITHTGDLSPVSLTAGVGTAATATSSRPSSSRPSTGSTYQGLGPLVTLAKPQGGFPSASQNWNVRNGYAQPQAGPSTPPNNNNNKTSNGLRATRSNVSLASVASTPSLYSHDSWLDNPSNYDAGDSDCSSVPHLPVLPSMAASSHQQQQQQHRRTSFGPVPSQQVTNSTDYQSHANMGSSSTSSRGGAVASSSSQEAPLYDEQRRPLNMLPEKAPLIRLDGALYQQRENEPPAYLN